MSGFLNRWSKRKSGLEVAEPELDQSKPKTQPLASSKINPVAAPQDGVATG